MQIQTKISSVRIEANTLFRDELEILRPTLRSGLREDLPFSFPHFRALSRPPLSGGLQGSWVRTPGSSLGSARLTPNRCHGAKGWR